MITLVINHPSERNPIDMLSPSEQLSKWTKLYDKVRKSRKYFQMYSNSEIPFRLLQCYVGEKRLELSQVEIIYCRRGGESVHIPLHANGATIDIFPDKHFDIDHELTIRFLGLLMQPTPNRLSSSSSVTL